MFGSFSTPEDGVFRFQVWPTEYRKITQHFGVNPQNYAQFGLPGHEGVDVRAPSGSNIYCVAPGTVIQVHTNSDDHNYGIHVRIQHQQNYVTIYAHLQKALVSEGEEVLSGTLLGYADNTGNSFGSHLHLTLKKLDITYQGWPRNIIDPTPFLLPLLGWQEPSGPYEEGWIQKNSLVIQGNLAQANPGGATLYTARDNSLSIAGGTIILIEDSGDQIYVSAKVPKAALGQDDPEIPTIPTPEPTPNIATVAGWGWAERLNVIETQAIINAVHGINLRAEPDENSQKIGIIQAGSTVSVTGNNHNNYLPILVRRADFIGSVRLTNEPLSEEVIELTNLPDSILLGWGRKSFFQPQQRHIIARHRGVSVYSRPSNSSALIGVIQGDTPVLVAGLEKSGYMPVLVDKNMMISIVGDSIDVEIPEKIPESQKILALDETVDDKDDLPGWVLTSDIQRDGDHAKSNYYLTIRYKPDRNAAVVGYLPPTELMLVMGMSFGEFTPIRVEETAVQPHLPDSSLLAEPGSFGQAQIGLHASADPDIAEAEHQVFKELKPGIIKVLSFHNPANIRRLADENPHANWIIRAFLDFGQRNITPAKFVEYTIGDVQRTLSTLKDKMVVVELHNEPNLKAEGLYHSWQDGLGFSNWFLDVLSRYRQRLPHIKYIYPGLSPGSSVSGMKVDHIQFLEASRKAVDAADGLGTHLYWSSVYPMSRALDVLDDTISRFRNKPIWITEASNNKGGNSDSEKAQQYLQFWRALQDRPIVQGVTYFVASASNPAFADETWVGHNISKIVGAR
ncbi:MAG: M23 family metallopeptidase [Chloroflexi bacterium]|nr:M23 family metallopeptidase [Chloroflexota bacterium]